MLHLIEGRSIYINYLETCYMGDLPFLPHFLICSNIHTYQYGLMDIYLYTLGY